MKQIAMLWLDTPRWVRGWFLGSLLYIVYFLAVFGLLNHPSLGTYHLFLFPILLLFADTPINVPMYMVHFIWCILGAGTVQLLGEIRGLVLLIIGMCAASAAVILYFLIQFSHSE